LSIQAAPDKFQLLTVVEISEQPMPNNDLEEPLIKVENVQADKRDVKAPPRTCLEVLKGFVTNPSYWPVFVLMCTSIVTFSCLIYYEFEHAFLAFSLVLGFMTVFLLAQVNGTYTLYTSVQLQEQIERFKEENEEFEQENQQLSVSIDSFTAENTSLSEEVDHLSGSVNKLKTTTDKMKSELEAFQAIRESMGRHSETMDADMKKALEQTEQLISRMHTLTEDNERTLLYKASTDLEFLDGDEGFTKEEFEKFVERVPKARIDQFWELAGNFEQLAEGADTVCSDVLGDIINKLVKKELPKSYSKALSSHKF